MGNKLTNCSNCAPTAVRQHNTNQNAVRIGVMKEDDIILKVDSGPRELQNTFGNSKPYWKESLHSIADSTINEFSKVRLKFNHLTQKDIGFNL